MKKNILTTEEVNTIISLYLQISNPKNRRLVYQYLYNLEKTFLTQNNERLNTWWFYNEFVKSIWKLAIIITYDIVVI